MLAALRTVIDRARRPLPDSLVDLDVAPAVPVTDREAAAAADQAATVRKNLPRRHLAPAQQAWIQQTA
ncbi:hypothetical protein L3i22_052520 [Actinoplanes sp. L3-i22]|nr:hypothetical protein L3i22_052520 [Actinoplanes sp. L3-i22]